MGLEFISDVIYGLKIDMGLPITVSICNSISIDQATGQKSSTIDSFPINLAIPLPENLRLQFLRNFPGLQREGGARVEGRHFLLDKFDIPSGKILSTNNTFLTYNGQILKIVAIDDYEKALDLTCQGVNNMSVA